MNTQNKTSAFRKLHQHAGTLLVLPNIWDAGSARIVEGVGAQAVATTSAGVAWSLGYQDGYQLPIELLARRSAEIVDAVTVPVTIDVENGYAHTPAAVVENLMPVFDTGISGINIEDGSDTPEVLAKKITALKKALAERGLDVFINARTDVYLAGLVADGEMVAETLRREAMYRDAGADGLFVPCIVADADIEAIVADAQLPVNVMAMPGLSHLNTLAKLGVRRLSAGGVMSQVAWKAVEVLSKEFLTSGNSDIFNDGLSFGAMQKYNAGRD